MLNLYRLSSIIISVVYGEALHAGGEGEEENYYSKCSQNATLILL